MKPTDINDGLEDLAPPRAPGLSLRPAEDRDSTVTIFPGADYLDSPPKQGRGQAVAGAHQEVAGRHPINTDMSWFNPRAT